MESLEEETGCLWPACDLWRKVSRLYWGTDAAPAQVTKYPDGSYWRAVYSDCARNWGRAAEGEGGLAIRANDDRGRNVWRKRDKREV